MNSCNPWDQLDEEKYAPEKAAIARLLAHDCLTPTAREVIVRDADRLVERARASAPRQGLVEGFLREFALGTREGLALMCLAEALLRIPDAETRDRLIAEKVAMADWASHLGQSDSVFVNASTWGLMLTGKLVDVDSQTRRNLPGLLQRLAARIGEPVIRQAVTVAMQIMAEQFVLGRTIGEALARASREGLTCSFDMLGEGARTSADALRHYHAYVTAIEAVGEAAGHAGPENGHGISIKLSALCPRFEATQEARLHDELYPRLKALALAAARHDLNLAIDAEEADRLVISLKLVDRLAREPGLSDWVGLGVVVQAYQKRGLAVIRRLEQLADETGRRIMVRLVKGAYWDSEIKAAQVAGMSDYPVFTTKAATDLAYLACARALIAASPRLYPQFATHNAHTLAAVRYMAGERQAKIEHQCLHGMGETLYAKAIEHYGPLNIRTYAPVGGHEELLPYLVRRLLENGANTSFVHQLLDEKVPVAQLVADPVAMVEQAADRHPGIPPPPDIYGPARRNSAGVDWSQCLLRDAAAGHLADLLAAPPCAAPIVGGAMSGNAPRQVTSPGDLALTIGTVAPANLDQIEPAIAAARAAQPAWDRAGGPARAQVIRRMGDALADHAGRLASLLVVEAGKTWPDATAELREAVDFCRYYAGLAEQQFAAPTLLTGPVGETNHWRLSARGVFACISPWNFPLSIFVGQITAALAAGNAVVAKPAEQTPLIAAETVRLFLTAGLDPGLVALLPGDGATIGAALVAHPAVAGVAFTGGTDTAWTINRSLAMRDGPIIPFIAETGGLNAMFVDNSALREQVIDDVIVSAFGSAGQRCSALRMLFLPEERADLIIEGLIGALETRIVGNPALPETDIGPVIDGDALRQLDAHVERLAREATILARYRAPAAQGHYFGPVIAEVSEPDFLDREVFGPILHVCRYASSQLPDFAQRLAARGYGLTLGIHSRLDQFAGLVQSLVPAGNTYICRSMVGAVVGVQPFGGLGLSGTGPKAGGPHALLRFCNEHSLSVNTMAQGGDLRLFSL